MMMIIVEVANLRAVNLLIAKIVIDKNVMY